jgi:hypothetical protein
MSLALSYLIVRKFESCTKPHIFFILMVLFFTYVLLLFKSCFKRLRMSENAYLLLLLSRVIFRIIPIYVPQFTGTQFYVHIVYVLKKILRDKLVRTNIVKIGPNFDIDQTKSFSLIYIPAESLKTSGVIRERPGTTRVHPKLCRQRPGWSGIFPLYTHRSLKYRQ